MLHRELAATDNGEEVPKEIRIHIICLFRFQRTRDEILIRLPPVVDTLRTVYSGNTNRAMVWAWMLW